MGASVKPPTELPNQGLRDQNCQPKLGGACEQEKSYPTAAAPVLLTLYLAGTLSQVVTARRTSGYPSLSYPGQGVD